MPIQLTEAQRRAVEAPVDQPLLILAAAGSGKTTVLCYRILHIISQGASAKDVLTVTFSRRAGQDLRRKLCLVSSSLKAAGSDVLLEKVKVCTFHSFCLGIIRSFPGKAGLSSDFIVLTPKAQLQIIEDLLREWYEVKRDLQNFSNPNNSLKYQGKNDLRYQAYKLYKQLRRLQNSKRCSQRKNDSFKKGNGLLEWVYDRYSEILNSLNCVDFSDFTRLAIKVLEGCEDAEKSVGIKARHILVDEFQDTDSDQFQLLRMLCKNHSNLTIVGDDDQEIYTWRGAAGFYNLTMFDKVFSGVTVTKLEQNFRSTGAIVAAARSVIAKNVNRTPKTIRTVSPTGNLLTVCECRNEQCEAAAVADFIMSFNKQNIPFREIAVLYRVQSVGFELQELLKARGIPCSTKGHGSGVGEGFQYNTAINSAGSVLHDILAVLCLVLHESDDLACKQLLELVCPEFRSSALYKYVKHLQYNEHLPLYQAIMVTRSHVLGLKKHKNLLCFDSQRTLSELDELVLQGLHLLIRVLEGSRKDIDNLKMKDVVMNLIQQVSPLRTGKKESPGHSSQNSNVEFFGIKALLEECNQYDQEITISRTNNSVHNNTASRRSYKDLLHQKTARHHLRQNYYGSQHEASQEKIQNGSQNRLESFLDRVFLKLYDGELGLREEITTVEAGSNVDGADSVVLSTIHQAKGLEWTVVILVRANEGVLPLTDSESEPEVVSPHAIDTGCHDALGMCQPAKMEKSGTMSNNQQEKQNIILLRNNTCKPQRTSEMLEEERRLIYVALTRAKHHLLITHVMYHGQQSLLPSRFLSDIPKGLMRKTSRYESVASSENAAVMDGKMQNISMYSPEFHKGSPGLKVIPRKHSKKKKCEEPKRHGCNGNMDVEESLNSIDTILEGATRQAIYNKEGKSTRSYNETCVPEDSGDDDFDLEVTFMKKYRS